MELVVPRQVNVNKVLSGGARAAVGVILGESEDDEEGVEYGQDEGEGVGFPVEVIVVESEASRNEGVDAREMENIEGDGITVGEGLGGVRVEE